MKQTIFNKDGDKLILEGRIAPLSVEEIINFLRNTAIDLEDQLDKKNFNLFKNKS